MAMPPQPMQQAMPPQGPPQKGPPKQPNPNKPEDMIGYIEPGTSPKVKTFLLAAKQILISPQGAQIVKGLLSKSNGDPSMPIAALIEKTIQKLEDKLGPLEDQEHDQVALHIAGWIVSSLQHMGMPGLTDAGARQDLIGRIMQALDQMTQGQGQQQQGQQGPPQQAQQPQQPPQGPPGQPPQGGGPMAQFGGP